MTQQCAGQSPIYFWQDHVPRHSSNGGWAIIMVCRLLLDMSDARGEPNNPHVASTLDDKLAQHGAPSHDFARHWIRDQGEMNLFIQAQSEMNLWIDHDSDPTISRIERIEALRRMWSQYAPQPRLLAHAT